MLRQLGLNMSNDAKLQKIILPPDFIDCSFGEPKVVTKTLFKHLGFELKAPLNYEYQPAQGLPALTKLLEEKYQAKVVITNGAKHGLSAILHALKKNKYDGIYYDTPHYTPIPGLMQDAGLTRSPYIYSARVLLLTSPNNPDGKTYTNTFMNLLAEDKYVIHDAAYNTPIYLPDGHLPEKVGHVQLYSLSKMYGMSGLRVGYVVCHDDTLFKDIVDYVETTTAGVSTASQEIALSIEEYFWQNPEKLKLFEQESRELLKQNRMLLNKLNPEVMTPNECMSNSMFSFCKKGSKLDFMKAKVHMLDGSLFGDATMIRMNLAIPYNQLKEAIERLNKI